MFKNFPGYKILEKIQKNKSHKRMRKIPLNSIKLIFIVAITAIIALMPTESFGIDGLTVVHQRIIALFVFAALMWLTETLPSWVTSMIVVTVMLLTVSTSALSPLRTEKITKNESLEIACAKFEADMNSAFAEKQDAINAFEAPEKQIYDNYIAAGNAYAEACKAMDALNLKADANKEEADAACASAKTELEQASATLDSLTQVVALAEAYNTAKNEYNVALAKYNEFLAAANATDAVALVEEVKKEYDAAHSEYEDFLTATNATVLVDAIEAAKNEYDEAYIIIENGGEQIVTVLVDSVESVDVDIYTKRDEAKAEYDELCAIYSELEAESAMYEASLNSAKAAYDELLYKVNELENEAATLEAALNSAKVRCNETYVAYVSFAHGTLRTTTGIATSDNDETCIKFEELPELNTVETAAALEAAKNKYDAAQEVLTAIVARDDAKVNLEAAEKKLEAAEFDDYNTAVAKYNAAEEKLKRTHVQQNVRKIEKDAKLSKGKEKPFTPYVPFKDILGCFANPTIMLFIGGFVLAIGLTKVKLDVALARVLLKPFGTRSDIVLLGFILVTAIFSAFVSNTATAAMMLAFLTPVLKSLPADGKGRIALALAIPVGANLGGMITPIGTPPNMIALDYLSTQGMGISFVEWTIRMAPFVILLLVLAWMLLRFMFPFKQKNIKIEIDGDIKWNYHTWSVVVAFVVTIFMWMFGTDLWGIDTNVVAMIPIAIFCATGILTRRDLEEINWSVLWMVAGGFALGVALNYQVKDADTGIVLYNSLSSIIVESVPFGNFSPLVVMILAGLICFAFSNFISHSAATSLLVPVLGVVAAGLGSALDGFGGPQAMLVGIAIASSVSMILPISTPPNAIAHSTGFIQQKDMMKVGIIIGVLGLVLGYGMLIFIGF